ncbi:hypothetical protein DB345_14500 [Spartobacteria bacterium LR76]|nr:hypothetical protein DB345_14500 [Spartobacteria bacterium LR76]
MDIGGVILILLAGAAIVAAVALFDAWMEKKRREAFLALAAELGLEYSPERDRSLAERCSFLNLLVQGDNRYAQHIFTGMYEGLPTMVFEYHYETVSRSSKGGRTVHHHYLSVFLTRVPGPVPELTIRPEGFLSKAAQALGYDDIDFESAEFSRKYCVRSRDKRFAYDVCHPAVIELLLQHPGVDIEIEGYDMALIKEYGLESFEVAGNLDLLTRFRQLWPDHLKEGRA